MTRITIVGDTFMDIDWLGSVGRVCADAPAPVLDAADEVRRPGGAGLAAQQAVRLGARVTLVTAVGADPLGSELVAALDAQGIDVVDLGLAGPTPSKLRLRANGQSLARVDRAGSPSSVGGWTDAATAALTGASAVLVSDYGRGLAEVPALAVLLQQLAPAVPVVWDPHPRGPRPLGVGLDLLTPNLSEAAALAGAPAGSAGGLVDALDLAARLAPRFDCPVAVTAGASGAALAEPGQEPVAVPVEPVTGDPCGAGDRFAAAVTVARARRLDRRDAVRQAVESARRFIAGGDGEVVGLDSADALALVARVRREGGTVVAAGGCFDVLHAGHIQLLDGARQLGDCLVVCLNGDLSVRRRKGRGRPVNRALDRAAVLQALRSVDAVVVFDEDTPCEVLSRLQPDIFVKGADYQGAILPEREVLARWGGRVVLLPVVEGRSTTRIVQAAGIG